MLQYTGGIKSGLSWHSIFWIPQLNTLRCPSEFNGTGRIFYFLFFITFLLPAMLRNARRAGMKVMKNNPPGAERNSLVSKLWLKSSLFANFVSRNSVEDSMSLDRNSFHIICVYRMICTFTQKPKTIFFKVSYQITPLDRHPEPLLEVAQSGHHLSVFPFSVVYKPGAFH